MHVEVNRTRLWFDVDGPALVPDGPGMRERPTVVLLHGGPGSYDHSYFKPDFARLSKVACHPGHAGALILQSTTARFDVGRLVEEFRRAGGDEVAEIAERAYGGDAASVTDEEWARCFPLFGPWVPGEQEQSRKIVNPELRTPVSS